MCTPLCYVHTFVLAMKWPLHCVWGAGRDGCSCTQQQRPGQRACDLMLAASLSAIMRASLYLFIFIYCYIQYGADKNVRLERVLVRPVKP
jgi:hypothetical protein